MIVKCEQCQTRFKIPDDRVTDKGVKVRCTKCQHMFRVTRDMAQPAAAAAPVPSPSRPPSATRPPAVAPPPEADPFARFGGASDASAHDETRPGVFALGVEASKSPAFSRPPPEPVKPASPSSKAFDFTSLAPSAPASAPRAVPKASAPPPPAPAPPPAARQSAPFDFAGLVATPSPPSPKMSPPGASPFDFSALGPASAPTESAAGLAFDFGTLGPVTASAPAPSALAAGRPAPPAFDFSALGPSPQSASTAATTKLSAFEPDLGQQPVLEHSQPPSPAPPAPLFADVPDLNEPSGVAASTMQPLNVPDDFFGTPLSPPPSAPGARGSYRTGASKEELFDMPLAAPAPEAAMEAIQLSGPAPVAAVSAPRTTGELETPSQRGKRRGALGLVVNLGIAVVLVAGLVIVGSALLNEGKLDATIFSASRLKALVTRASDFEASDISNGLYDTLRGKPVFFVRGEVTNHSATATRVRVRAEILDGQSLVRAAEVVAGTPPTPEQLRNLTGADEVERLLTAVSKTAPSLAPGESAPFLVTFFEYPPDLKAFRVRVSARAEGSETAER